MKPLVKICGICSLKDAELSVSLGAGALGFNFYKKSKRYIEPLRAREIISALKDAGLSEQLILAGVFVNQEREEVAKIAEEVRLNTLQFHGDEKEQILQGWSAYKIVRAVRLTAETKISALEYLRSLADFLLLDSYSSSSYGGTGKTLPEDLLQKIQGTDILSKAFLAGGLNAENIEEKVRKYSPFAVDIASGVELEPGKKCPIKLQQFFKAL